MEIDGATIYREDTEIRLLPLPNGLRFSRLTYPLSFKHYSELGLPSGTVAPVAEKFLCSKLVDGRCEVQSSVELVVLVVRNFPWFSSKLA